MRGKENAAKARNEGAGTNYQGSKEGPDLLNYKHMFLTMGHWAPTDGGCFSLIALGLFALLIVFSCSFILNNFW